MLSFFCSGSWAPQRCASNKQIMEQNPKEKKRKKSAGRKNLIGVHPNATTSAHEPIQMMLPAETVLTRVTHTHRVHIWASWCVHTRLRRLREKPCEGFCLRSFALKFFPSSSNLSKLRVHELEQVLPACGTCVIFSRLIFQFHLNFFARDGASPHARFIVRALRLAAVGLQARVARAHMHGSTQGCCFRWCTIPNRSQWSEKIEK